jgi:hypothetical protein
VGDTSQGRWNESDECAMGAISITLTGEESGLALLAHCNTVNSVLRSYFDHGEDAVVSKGNLGSA